MRLIKKLTFYCFTALLLRNHRSYYIKDCIIQSIYCITFWSRCNIIHLRMFLYYSGD
jgi:hypothetical protein